MSETPDWFATALAVPSERRVTVVDGREIVHHTWGEPGGPPVILVHGRGAHGLWWSHLAPYLCDGRSVTALDLSGHGDSGWRDSYGIERWAQEIMAVAADVSDRPPVLVGHSMGGTACLTIAVASQAPLAGVAVIDSPVGVPHGRPPAQQRTPRRSASTYASREELLSRFRLVPDDPRALGFVKDHIAALTVREVDGGWAWKTDPATLAPVLVTPDDLGPVDCPVALVRAEHGLATRRTTAEIAGRLGADVRTTEIPDAGHHVLLDQPLAVVSVLRLLLADWVPATG
ncbi:alpha/beta hydrolase [Nocardioides sp. KR10-350]|uniref:alpha/beta fold hydrolase n=1 Tax=Nocardioides cheoyonin TaxID=3156615 RepID=UPI0032B32DF4